MTSLRYLLLLFCLSLSATTFAQRDIDFHINGTFLQGKKVLKIKHDFFDTYLWVLTENNGVYRINGATKQVIDYSDKFNTYNGIRFKDIAGASAERVFIAPDAASVIDYNNGSVKLLGTDIGITGLVNSIGMDAYTHEAVESRIAIATANGMIYYKLVDGSVRMPTVIRPSYIYEASYRNFMMHDGESPRWDDVIPHFTLFEHFAYTIYGNEVWLGGDYGNTLRSAYYTRGSMWDYHDAFTIFMNQFWATEKGLFEIPWRAATAASGQQQHYLAGKQINKISSVYGLPGFTYSSSLGYDNDKGRENLLVGADDGLYFSNSLYLKNGANGTLKQYDFYHYDGLGSKKINDICTEFTPGNILDAYANYSPPCENEIWIAADDGLYILATDYGAYIDNTQPLSGAYIEGSPSSPTELMTCGDINANLHAGYGYTNNNFKWVKDGVELIDANAEKLNVNAPGDYYAIIYDGCTGMHFETNHLKVTKLDGPVFTFNYPDKLYYCFGSTATLQTEANTNYRYRWYRDDVLNGNTTNQLSITQNGKYKLEVSACSGSWTPTKEVEINFIKVPQPDVTPDKTAYCMGETAVLSTSVPTDATGVINWQPYQYRWYKDGVLIGGANSSTLSVTQTGKYKAEVTACSGNSATSVEVQPNFISLQTISIYSDKQGYCAGSQATLSIKPPSGNVSYTVDWTRNGVALPAEHNKTSIVTGVAGSYKASVGSTLTTCNQISDEFILTFETPPTLIITRTDNTPLCSGQTIGLSATSSGGTISWSNGQTTPQISVNTSGSYMATVKTIAGCEVARNYDVQFLNNPSLNVPDATLCQFTNEQITLTAPVGFARYEWNGQLGSSTYITSQLGQVRLKVTDANGCFATQTISVNSHCDNIHIPNAFTPNGDGNNDRWIIGGLEGDPTVNVKIYNRLGKAIFESRGYSVPWDGTFGGQKLPAGVYYYVISAKKSSQVLSGYLTLIY